MNLDPNAAVTTTHGSTGPRTDAGKASSSQNAIRTGLYAARDFVRPGEEEEYAQTLIQLMEELTPEGTLEQTFATEIMGATWRLRRCRLVEESFANIEDLTLDAMIDEKTEKAQRSVDRARSQSHLILRRSIAELRKLQTERTTQQENAPAAAPRPSANALPDFGALMALADKQLARQYREGGLSALTKNVPAPNGTSFCNPAPAAPVAPKMTPRNATCPCGSGTKFKRCCGRNAPPMLHRAA